MNRLRSRTLPVVQLHDALRSDLDTLPDGELLERFARYGDHAAFEVLVRRHGPMVFGVCRRVLATADADDAFQATFLVLIRKAKSLRGGKLGPWLYGVAYRVALKARVRESRLADYRTGATEMIPDPTPPADVPDWLPLLDAELAALPAKYRDPLVMCELQGTARAAAAKTLGIPEGTLSSRLARGRELLRKRLLKHGTLLPSGGLAVLIGATSVGGASVPAALLTRTSELAKTSTVAGAVPVGAAQLTDEVLKGMFLTKLRAVGSAVVALALVSVGLAAALPADTPSTSSEGKGFTSRLAPPLESSPKTPAAPAKMSDRGLLSGVQELFTRPADVPQPPPKFASDREAIQGLWTVEKIDFGKAANPDELRQMREAAGQMQILVTGDVWWGMKGGPHGEIFPQRVKLDPTKNPKWMDMGELNPGQPNEFNNRCIYEIDGDKLRICMCAADRGRPAEFNTDDDSPLIVMQLKRSKMPAAAGEKGLVGSWVNAAPGQSADRVELFESFLFLVPERQGKTEIGGKYTVDTTKNPKWIDVELVAPLDGKFTKLYGSYEVANGRLKMALGSKRATRPLEFKNDPDVLFFDLQLTPRPSDLAKPPDAVPVPVFPPAGVAPLSIMPVPPGGAGVPGLSPPGGVPPVSPAGGGPPLVPVPPAPGK